MPPVNHVPPSSILTTEIVYVKSRFFRVQVSPTEKLGATADCAYTSDAAEHSSVIKKKEAFLRGLVRVLARQTGSTSPIRRMGTSVADGWRESSRPELWAVCAGPSGR